MNRSILIATLCLAACVQGTASDTFSKTETLSFPPEPGVYNDAGVPLNVDVTVDQTTVMDMSGAVSSLQKVGTVSLSFPVNSLSDDNLSFVHHIRLSATPTDGSMQELVLADYDVPSNTTNVINIPVDRNVPGFGNVLASYFGHGPLVLHFWLTGDLSSAAGYPAGGITVTHKVVVDANLTLDKSVSNIGH